MSISLNEWLVNSYHFVKNNIQQRLSPLQKKIAVFTTAFFSCIPLGNLISRYCQFKASQVPKGGRDENTSPLQQQMDGPTLRKGEFHTQQAANKKGLTIQERLQKNIVFARQQQQQEASKTKFSILQEHVQQDVIQSLKLSRGSQSITHAQQEVNGYSVGDACCQGARSKMEDQTLVSSLDFSIQEKCYTASVFAVFDGHGGDQAAIFVQQNFAKYFIELMQESNRTGLTDEGIWNAFKACFKKLNQDYTNRDPDGTTATVGMVLEGKIWVANVGDSRTILVKDGKATQASEDAKPTINRYRNKIIKKGGIVWGKKVNGELAVARAIGDKEIVGKTNIPVISPNPKITSYSLSDFQGGYLVLACDGLYDVATTNEVGQAIEEMAKKKLTTKEMARRLVVGALNHNSQDNVSVIVVRL
jgi:serine/threonine protein phosphatase PrpC